MNTVKNNKGFTIIEVVLVLAIAGLIFLVVFLALPALQRSQRDTQRRSDMSRFLSQIQNYQSNNQGQVPTTAASGTGSVVDFRDRYLVTGGDTFNDPQKGSVYTVAGKTTASFSSDKPAVGTIYYYVDAKCNGEAPTTGSGNRNVAIITQLEGGAYYCQSN